MSTNTEASLFRESQRLTQWWIWAIVAGVALLAWIGFISQIVLQQPLGERPAPDWAMWLIWAFAGVGLPLLISSCRLIVEVRQPHLHITYIPFFWKRIPWPEITSCEAVTYRPILHYGGWGIRWSPRYGWAYSISGQRGVQLVLASGKRILLGSQHPDELAQAIQNQRQEFF